ncbi:MULTISPECIES: aspartyl-phosphate phosphatase Spo0E family protein [Clostridium]|uniref:aspartyl-phosphate phosphatase Spo0E family protein n=1 Tax=Clostridium TaxID=1485 RepID=UPI0009BD33DA|nr:MULTISPECIES: aspartyl-phosphate phosphatase Spo0E family protein [Clostridium]PJI06536.1 aspartyl-phosphate phosphatase Spo0E family protein [Clostridium sp. CT7]
MENRIEKLRQELYVLIKDNKLTDSSVIMKSQELQNEINNFMKEELEVKAS